MDAIERVTKVLRGELPDRVPVGTALLSDGLPDAWGTVRRDSPRWGVDGRGTTEAWRMFGHDVIMLEIGVCAEAEALGCTIRYTADGPPHVAEPLINDLDDIEKLRVPDPERTFPLNEMLKTTRIVKRETGGKVFINGRSDQGPIALALRVDRTGTVSDHADGGLSGETGASSSWIFAAG